MIPVQYLLIKVAQLIPNPGTKLPNQNVTESSLQATIENVFTIAFGVLGALCVLIITLAGLQYIISSGDPAKTAKAKDTIMYAVIGLVVAIFAVTIINFVIKEAT
ncbi:MAG TPA: pilin [Candidatus Saccharibacteria bacterium]|nr:pilin [Candidatus Saccharibacteria bacterium]